MVSQSELRGALRRYWGYDSFRPLQEKVVRSLIGGHDTCVIMPTGFGKSLCYQLPAAMLSNETVIVVSPSDCPDAGPSGATDADGNSLGAAEQHTLAAATGEGHHRGH